MLHVGNALDAAVNGVGKSGGRRLYRRKRMANPEQKTDYGEAVSCCVESFFAVPKQTIIKGFAIQLGKPVPTKVIGLPLGEQLAVARPWFSKDDLTKIRYMPVPIVQKRLIGRRARTGLVEEHVRRIESERLVRTHCFVCVGVCFCVCGVSSHTACLFDL